MQKYTCMWHVLSNYTFICLYWNLSNMHTRMGLKAPSNFVYLLFHFDFIWNYSSLWFNRFSNSFFVELALPKCATRLFCWVAYPLQGLWQTWSFISPDPIPTTACSELNLHLISLIMSHYSLVLLKTSIIFTDQIRTFHQKNSTSEFCELTK